MGDPGPLKLIVSKFELRVVERFAPGDINVEVRNEVADEVTDMCEQLNITWELVGSASE
jgi:hypothetical protein